MSHCRARDEPEGCCIVAAFGLARVDLGLSVGVHTHSVKIRPTVADGGERNTEFTNKKGSNQG